MKFFEKIFTRLYFLYDDFYRHRHSLEPVGPLLLIQRDKYSGEQRCFDDDTVLIAGQPLGILHFDNKYLLRNGASHNMRRAGLIFREKLFCSLELLAKAAHAGKYEEIPVYSGVTWIPAHGEKVGFRIEPLAGNWRSRLLALHFSIILYAFYGSGKAGNRVRYLRPHRFWLTRKQLLANFLR